MTELYCSQTTPDSQRNTFYKTECFEQTISNITLYKCFSVCSCTVIPITILSNTLNQCIIPYTTLNNLVVVRLCRTPGRRKGSSSTRIARSRCFASSPARCKLDHTVNNMLHHHYYSLHSKL